MRSTILPFLLAGVIAPANAQEVPAGRLGYPLGTYLKIEGVKMVDGVKTGGRTLLVDMVNGKKLAEPTGVGVENIESLPTSTRCILRGYEMGGMVGQPPALEEADREEGKSVSLPQAGWQFRRWFVVLSVVEPASSITITTPIAQKTHVSDLNPPSRVIGRLDAPLGTRLTIGGVLADNVMLPNPLEVSEINEQKVKQPVSIEIRGDLQIKVQIEKGVHYRLEGYEAGGFSGPPYWHRPNAQQPFQFYSFFVVTKVLEPSETPMVGRLGKPVGTELTIEGTFQGGKNSWLLVTTVNGEKLGNPVEVPTGGLDPFAQIPRNTVCRFKGKEVTYVVRYPGPITKDTLLRDLPQQSSGRHFDFVVTEVLVPKGVKTRAAK
jgi:hypothetical protein